MLPPGLDVGVRHGKRPSQAPVPGAVPPQRARLDTATLPATDHHDKGEQKSRWREGRKAGRKERRKEGGRKKTCLFFFPLRSMCLGGGVAVVNVRDAAIFVVAILDVHAPLTVR